MRMPSTKIVTLTVQCQDTILGLSHPYTVLSITRPFSHDKFAIEVMQEEGHIACNTRGIGGLATKPHSTLTTIIPFSQWANQPSLASKYLPLGPIQSVSQG